MPDSEELDNILKELKHKGDPQESIPADDNQIKAEKPEADEPEFTVSEEVPFEEAFSEDTSSEIISEDFELSEQNDSEKITISDEPEYEEYEEINVSNSNNNKKKIIAIAVAVVAVIAIIVTVVLIKGNSKEPETTAPVSTTASTTAAPVIVNNPLTNEGSYNQSAAKVRPAAIVVENAAQARPQWGINDETKSPDIIVEGEVEGGESRMLWLYADYTALPDQIGPIRSARPPFIKFSEMFDAIFIHWGQSSSKGSYIGANTVFQEDGVDHINQMAFSDKVGLFGRDKSRGVSSEHTGVIYGSKLSDAIAQEGFRTEAKDSSYTKFNFNDEDKTVSETDCSTIDVTFSSRSKTRSWAFSDEDKMYHSSDYKTDVARKNILVLYDNTEYVVKENYKGSGRSETYCDYKLAGGTGKLATMGTITDITWSVENGVLVLKDSEGKALSLNTGKTWIGWASANNGGTDAE